MFERIRKVGEIFRLPGQLYSYDVITQGNINFTYKVTYRDSNKKTKAYIIAKQLDLLDAELRVTSQRVNLFEKVKIPEAKENIRVIGVYLGDQQTAAVVRGKISKKKLEGAAR